MLIAQSNAAKKNDSFFMISCFLDILDVLEVLEDLEDSEDSDILEVLDILDNCCCAVRNSNYVDIKITSRGTYVRFV